MRNMSKVIPILIFVGSFVLSIYASCFGAQIEKLFGVDCKRWTTFVDNFVDSYKEAAKENEDLSTNEEMIEMVENLAVATKTGYIIGIIDTYKNAHIITDNKRFIFPDRVDVQGLREYKRGINTFCSKPENKDKKITEVLLFVNEEMQKAQQ